MPKMSFKEQKPYESSSNKSNAWTSISKQLLGYYAPKDAALLLPRDRLLNDSGNFMKSRVLDHIREESEIDKNEKRYRKESHQFMS